MDLPSSLSGEALADAGDRLERVSHSARDRHRILIPFGHQLIEMSIRAAQPNLRLAES